MEAAFFKEIGWAAVILFGLLFAVICFLAVLWSKREWNTRKIRVGMFLEREYLHEEKKGNLDPPADLDDTLEIPPRRRDDAR